MKTRTYKTTLYCINVRDFEYGVRVMLTTDADKAEANDYREATKAESARIERQVADYRSIPLGHPYTVPVGESMLMDIEGRWAPASDFIPAVRKP